MTSHDPLASLLDHQSRTAALERVNGVIHWDQETQMPAKGAAQRAEEAGALAAAIHAMHADPRLGAWIAALQPADLAPRDTINLEEARRAHSRALLIPEALAIEIARVSSSTQTAWEDARAAASFGDFAEVLARLVGLKRQEAQCLAAPGMSPYDALLDEYEPGVTAESLSRTFGALRGGLVALRERVSENGAKAPRLEGFFPGEAQLGLARKVCEIFGFDAAAGRLDLAAHPSSSGTLGDVRITTRINPADPLECLYATIHELGHGLYEQGLDPADGLLPAGSAASTGVHESQSRLMENQIGRSRAFMEWLFPALRDAFGEIGVGSPEELYRAANAVRPGFIRTEADEVHYNLHIMMRFDLERALISGDLPVADLEATWNERFAADFGRPPPDAAQGVLQDIHWPIGLFGYFPTYTLGNVYAAELDRAVRREIPELDAQVSKGEIAPLLGWLREKVHRIGRLHPPARVIEDAIGRKPDPATLLAGLDAKFGGLFAPS